MSTKIEWTHVPGFTGETWNPYRAASGKGWHCSKISEGCVNCYAEAMNRWRGSGLPYCAGADHIVLHEPTLTQPKRWRKPRMVFVNSMSDTFHESVSNRDIERLFYVMAETPRHTYQVLTKRTERMRPWVAASFFARHPLSNVWFGATIENQRRFDERIQDVMATPAAVWFLSLEPLLGPVDLSSLLAQVPDPGRFWIIVGGESGPKARPMHPDWARSIRDQCAEAGVPFLFKQQGEWAPTIGKLGRGELRHVPNGAGTSTRMRRVGKKAAGRLLDGVEHTAFPQGGP